MRARLLFHPWAAVPIVLDNNRAAIEAAFRCNWGVKPEDARIFHIPNTLHLSEIEVSQSIAAELSNDPLMTIASEPYELSFDSDGWLVNDI